MNKYVFMQFEYFLTIAQTDFFHLNLTYISHL